MAPDGAFGHEYLLGDLPVGQTVNGEPGNLELAAGERGEPGEQHPAGTGSSGAQLIAGQSGPAR